MRKMMVAAVAVTALTLGFFAATTVSHAQVNNDVFPRDTVYCETERYDLNGDSRLGKSDMYYWMQTAQNRGCAMGSGAVGNCASLDIDQNGTIEIEDALTMYNHFLTCYVPARNTDPGTR